MMSKNGFDGSEIIRVLAGQLTTVAAMADLLMNHRPPTTVVEKDRFNRDVRRRHIANRTSILTTEHHQSDSTCNEDESLSTHLLMRKLTLGCLSSKMGQTGKIENLAATDIGQKEIKVEWSKGLAQKKEAEARLEEMELQKTKPFARQEMIPMLIEMGAFGAEVGG
ncbi:BUD13 protein [Tanacetum coccineum]